MSKIISLLYHPKGRIGLAIGMAAGLLVGLAGPFMSHLGRQRRNATSMNTTEVGAVEYL